MSEVPAGTGADVGPVGRGAARVHVGERPAWAITGFLPLIVGVSAIIGGVWVAILGGIREDAGGSGAALMAAAVVLLISAALALSGITVVSPGQTKVVQFFGRYVGTVRTTGLVMVVPLSTRVKVSVKVHNFETNELKVNDANGNPINIAAIVVWQVAETAKATFAVESYADFVQVQAESALRHVAMSHPYDTADDTISLRGDTEFISKALAHEVAERVVIGGIEVIEVRISSLAYAPEIAQAMLQRQQASAVIAAREQIVEGAVGMVENALEKLEAGQIVDLDDERKAAMVSNLLVVLCSERGTTPVVNASNLYT
ncbi:MAG: SPFH domain-containing protein [Propioniciclava sp.]